MRGQISLFRISLGLALAVLAAVPAVSASAQRQQSTRSPHGPLNIPCENCHTATGWTPIRAVPEFNHDSTRYPLRGMHEKVSCTGCHLKPIFTDVGKNCADCHADIHRRQFGANCAQCHTVSGWNVSVQAINNHFNRFPLLGAHAVVQCDQCHTNAAAGQFTGLSTTCQSCHMKDWQNTTSPPHAKNAKAFDPTQCQQCHKSFDTWLNASFSVTGGAFDHAGPPINFPLTLGHASVACEQCHVGGNYQLQIDKNDCGNSMCHLTKWQQTNNPPHQTAGAAFALANCSNCHTPASWNTANFDHSVTGFQLTLGHANLACASCHISNNYNLTMGPRDCGNSQCHLTTWQQTNNPVHSTSGPNFAAASCANCHTPAGWTGAAFDHSVTGFTLIGTHVSPTPTPCASCHTNNNYTLSSTDCYGCHQAAYLSTQTMGGSVPNHVTAQFPITASACASCHPITTWAAGTFDHASFGFPLTNGHANVACNLCHINNNYSLQIAATDCGNSQCHLTTWQGTNNPAHSSAGPAFAAANCSTCHTTAGWTAASFDHSVTGFTLVGTHMSPTPTPCASCHVSNNYTLNSTDCYGCHQAAFVSTQTIGGAVPNHVAANFPTTAAQCASCHPITTWAAGTFNHASFGFPLTNGHANVACNLCHIGNNFSLTIAATDCGNSQCHLTTWQTTNAPPHPSAGPLFAAANCANCHATTGWTTATFDHNTTGFALTGLHVSPVPTPCASCHINNNYALNAASTACINCHLPAWQSTATLGGAVPNHITAGFPQDCSICHSTINWTTSTFNHNATTFPLTGAHTTTACALCHVGASGYSGNLPTDCYGCHAAAWQSTATLGGAVPNHLTAGYPTTCASCHTTTSWLGAVFNHSATRFGALTGAHATIACNLCHTSATPPPLDCYSCHTVAWLSTRTLGGQVPDHTASDATVAGIVPSACGTCHTTTNWLGATFTHSWFNQQHGNSGGVCTVCHISVATSGYSVFQCTVCHGNNNAANFNHPSVGGRYVYSSPACYQCHSRG